MARKRAAQIIASRNELHKLMEKTINTNLRSMEERGEYAEYAVKTNIIEANCKIEDIPTKIFEYNIELKKTLDKFLYVMIIKRENKSFVLYLDTFFSRFWKLYNIEESSVIDRFIDQFANNILRIDSLWMPHQMLNELEKGLKNVGFSIRFKQEVLNEEELSEEEISQLSMRLWSKGSKPSNEIVTLLEKNGFPTTKTSTRLLNETDNEIKFLDEVYYDGKITVSKGTDIEEHVQFVDHIIDEYAKKMIMIEAERMYLEPKDIGLKVHGNPFELKFSKNQSIEKLAVKLTNSTKPFRIWGVVHDKDEDFLRIAGVDTHTGDKFDIDLMPDYGRIYLPKNACGNLIFRLYTNIQHALDPGVIICDEHGRLF
jgi:hypothetical protein